MLSGSAQCRLHPPPEGREEGGGWALPVPGQQRGGGPAPGDLRRHQADCAV